MNLEEIEAKADELAAQLVDPDTHSAVVRDVAFRLDGLSRAAQIKATVAFRKEQALPNLNLPTHPKPEASPRCQQVYRCTRPAGHISRGIAHAWVGYPATVVDPEEPTKPVADRLHELVSYLVSQSVEEHHKADEKIEGWRAAKFVAASKAYDDAASKLQEILQEGGI